MKRLIIFICLIVIIFLGYTWINKGFNNAAFEIASYNTLETKSKALTQKLGVYDRKNGQEYDTAITSLNSSVKQYKDAKAQYEAILTELEGILNTSDDQATNETIEEIIYSDQEKYKVDFLLVTLGEYGEKEGVDVFYQLTTSSTTDPNSSTMKFFLADLKFTITGQYMDVANFISDLENDSKLNWEIKDFEMASGNSNGYSGVSAKFTVKAVPIDSESYLNSTTSTTTTPEQETTANDTNTNTNTVSNTVSDSTSNTVSNSVTNSVTNTTATNTIANTVANNTVN